MALRPWMPWTGRCCSSTWSPAAPTTATSRPGSARCCRHCGVRHALPPDLGRAFAAGRLQGQAVDAQVREAVAAVAPVATAQTAGPARASSSCACSTNPAPRWNAWRRCWACRRTALAPVPPGAGVATAAYALSIKIGRPPASWAAVWPSRRLHRRRALSIRPTLPGLGAELRRSALAFFDTASAHRPDRPDWLLWYLAQRDRDLPPRARRQNSLGAPPPHARATPAHGGTVMPVGGRPVVNGDRYRTFCYRHQRRLRTAYVFSHGPVHSGATGPRPSVRRCAPDQQPMALFCALVAPGPLAAGQLCPGDTPRPPSACAPGWPSASGAARALPDVQKIADLPYGPDARQRMDIYRPSTSTPDPSGARAPVVFMVHGGGWRNGDKAMPAWCRTRSPLGAARGDRGVGELPSAARHPCVPAGAGRGPGLGHRAAAGCAVGR